jgi:serine/threonine protein kinase
MADVYLGVQENLAREVAIKIMIPTLFRDEQFSARFIKEAQTAAQLAHPNIITIHDVGNTGDTYYIVMEYLPECLSARMKEKGVPAQEEALNIIMMIASALDYAHGKGFIHRDIKPDNIMFRNDGTVVLVDFGIARAMDSGTQLTRTGMSIGTPHYMSPEQCRGEKIDGRSDIYSLGVVLYEILTGDVPYKAENTAGVMIKHIQDPIPHLPVEFAHLQPLFERLMCKDRDQRIQDGRELSGFIDALSAPASSEFAGTVPLTRPEFAAASDQVTVITPHSTQAYAASVKGTKKKWLLPLLLFFFVAIAATALVVFLPKLSEKPQDKTPGPLPPEHKQQAKQDQPLQKKPAQEKKKPSKEPVKKSTQTKKPARQEKAKPPAITKPKPSPQPKEDSLNRSGQFDTYLDQVRDYFAKGDYDKALESLEEAKKLKRAPFLNKLERRIRTARRMRQPGAGETETLKGESAASVPAISVADLHPDIHKQYDDRMKHIQIPISRMGSMFSVSGSITIDFSIDENGRVTARPVRDNLTIMPRMRTRNVKRRIIGKLNGVIVKTPPKDKNNKPARLENWRVNFEVEKNRNSINLRKNR